MTGFSCRKALLRSRLLNYGRAVKLSADEVAASSPKPFPQPFPNRLIVPFQRGISQNNAAD